MIALATNAIVKVLTEDDGIQAKHYQAEKLFSFDRKLQNLFPDFVIESITI